MVTDGSTVLGKSISVRGEITGTEDLLIDGKVEGTINLAKCRLTLGPNSQVQADLQVHDAVLLGRCEGNIAATGRVDLRRSGALLGDVAAAGLSIEEGAAIRGKVSLTGKQE